MNRLRQAQHARLLGNSRKSGPRAPPRTGPGPGTAPRAASDPPGPARPAARRARSPRKGGPWPGRAGCRRPRGREQSCQVPSCCLASFSRSFNVHSSRISESPQHQLSSDLLLCGGCYHHRGHLTSGSRPGFFWQSRTVGTLFHLNGNSDGSQRPLPPPRILTSS